MFVALLVAIAVAVSGEDTFMLRGDLTLRSESIIDNGNVCGGTGGYSDIRPGASVTVYDADGRIIGSGHISNSTTAGSPQQPDCQLSFAVEVPAGLDFYSVEVGRRGRVTFPADRAEQGVQLTLGN